MVIIAVFPWKTISVFLWTVNGSAIFMKIQLQPVQSYAFSAVIIIFQGRYIAFLSSFFSRYAANRYARKRDNALLEWEIIILKVLTTNIFVQASAIKFIWIFYAMPVLVKIRVTLGRLYRNASLLVLIREIRGQKNYFVDW